MNIPDELKYTEDHEWVRIENNLATIGITDYAQGELGDIVFVELPAVGDTIEKTKELGTIEAVKAVAELYAPLTGKVMEINKALEDDPMIVNSDPYNAGWMVKMEISDPSETEKLLNAASYREIINA
ncbi:MAG: glycine cleavage system protein GcvH [candidate division Zixibacteria bacterium]|nr:glycine cleavage system protein GcvH [candidate division Zixibacteria bacterium]